jgi:hypothetical protein
VKNSFLRLGVPGFVDLFKTTSNLYIADSLIFKGLMSYFSMMTNHSDTILRRKPLKIRLLQTKVVSNLRCRLSKTGKTFYWEKAMLRLMNDTNK